MILHGKKGQFIEFEKPLVDDKESEANDFAANLLIPKVDLDVFLNANDFSRKSVFEFAKKINVHPDIVEGRLKHEKKLTWQESLGFQRQLTFQEVNTV